MLLLLLIYVVLRALWKIDVHLISTLVNKSLYYFYYYNLLFFFSFAYTTSPVIIYSKKTLSSSLSTSFNWTFGYKYAFR